MDAATALNLPLKHEGIAKTSRKLTWLAIITKFLSSGKLPLIFNLHPNIHIINLQNGIIKEYNADGYINITSSIRGPKKINVRNERK